MEMGNPNQVSLINMRTSERKATALQMIRVTVVCRDLAVKGKEERLLHSWYGVL
jgi:hypothetical protein